MARKPFYENKNYCSLCEKYYPKAFRMCPVHTNLKLRTRSKHYRYRIEHTRIDLPDTEETAQ